MTIEVWPVSAIVGRVRALWIWYQWRARLPIEERARLEMRVTNETLARARRRPWPGGM